MDRLVEPDKHIPPATKKAAGIASQRPRYQRKPEPIPYPGKVQAFVGQVF